MTLQELLDQLTNQIQHMVDQELTDQFQYNKSKFGTRRFKLDRHLAISKAMGIPVVIGRFNGRRELNSTEAIEVSEWKTDIAVKSRESVNYSRDLSNLTVLTFRSKLTELGNNRPSNLNRDMKALTLMGPESIRSIYYNRYKRVLYLNI